MPVLNSITSFEIPPLIDEMASHRNMQILIAPSNRREIISAIKELKQIKATEFDDLSTELSIAAPVASADLLLPPV